MRVSRHQAVLLEKELASPSLAHLVSLNGIHWQGFAKLITFQSLVTNNKPLCQTLIFCFLPDVMHLLLFIRFNPVWLLQSSKQCCGSWKLKVEECGKALSRRRDEDATWLKLLVWTAGQCVVMRNSHGEEGLSSLVRLHQATAWRYIPSELSEILLNGLGVECLI